MTCTWTFRRASNIDLSNSVGETPASRKIHTLLVEERVHNKSPLSWQLLICFESRIYYQASNFPEQAEIAGSVMDQQTMLSFKVLFLLHRLRLHSRLWRLHQPQIYEVILRWNLFALVQSIDFHRADLQVRYFDKRYVWPTWTNIILSPFIPISSSLWV